MIESKSQVLAPKAHTLHYHCATTTAVCSGLNNQACANLKLHKRFIWFVFMWYRLDKKVQLKGCVSNHFKVGNGMNEWMNESVVCIFTALENVRYTCCNFLAKEKKRKALEVHFFLKCLRFKISQMLSIIHSKAEHDDIIYIQKGINHFDKTLSSQVFNLTLHSIS